MTAALTDDETHAMCEYRCVFVEKRLNFIMHQLRTDGLWPISGLERYSIEHVWRLLEGTRVTSANVYQSSKLDMCNQATCGGLLLSDSYDLGKIDDQIAKCLKDTWWNVKPVCYHCAREDKLSYPGCKHSER